MAPLSDELCDAIHIARGSMPEALVDKLEDSPDLLDGLLTSADGRAGAVRSLAERHLYDLKIVEQRGEIQQRFCSLQLEDVERPVLAGLISSNADDALSSSLENLVLWAVLDPTLDWHRGWREAPGGRVSEWRQLGTGRVILALPRGIAAESERFICVMLGLDHAEAPFPGKLAPLISGATSVTLAAPSSSITQVRARLLREAAACEQPKWRCLSLYRILEHAYLASVKRTLLAEFDADASRALKSATDKLATEAKQLIALAEESDLTNEFVLLDGEFVRLRDAGNQFVNALDRNASDEALYNSPTAFKKAALRFYKLRCSIAHAGTSSVFYERFADADVAVTAMLPFIEAIVLKSMKISRA